MEIYYSLSKGLIRGNFLLSFQPSEPVNFLGDKTYVLYKVKQNVKNYINRVGSVINGGKYKAHSWGKNLFISRWGLIKKNVLQFVCVGKFAEIEFYI